MKTLLRFSLAVYAAFTLYTLLDIGFGSTGVYATEKLITYREELARNVEDLKKHNQELKEELRAFQESTEKVKLSARIIGYYEKNEGIIHPEGYRGEKSFYSVGRYIKSEVRYYAEEELFRAFSISLGLVIFFFLTLLGRKRDDSRKES